MSRRAGGGSVRPPAPRHGVSQADVEAVQAASDLARISVAAETARRYVDACSAGHQLAVAQESVAIKEQTFDLTRPLQVGSRGTALETGQDAAQLEQTRADPDAGGEPTDGALPPLRPHRPRSGRVPARSRRLLHAARALQPDSRRQRREPSCPAPGYPRGGAPACRRHRPDRRRDGRSLPRRQPRRLDWLHRRLARRPRLWGRLPLQPRAPDQLELPQNPPRPRPHRAGGSGRRGALGRFDGTWLGALEETESALTRYAGELERLAALRRARAAGNAAARVARLRYRAARESFQIVLEAERSLSQIEATLADAESQLSNNLVSLFLALGGGRSRVEVIPFFIFRRPAKAVSRQQVAQRGHACPVTRLRPASHGETRVESRTRSLIRILYLSCSAPDSHWTIDELRVSLEVARGGMSIPKPLVGAPAGPSL